MGINTTHIEVLEAALFHLNAPLLELVEDSEDDYKYLTLLRLVVEGSAIYVTYLGESIFSPLEVKCWSWEHNHQSRVKLVMVAIREAQEEVHRILNNQIHGHTSGTERDCPESTDTTPTS